MNGCKRLDYHSAGAAEWLLITEVAFEIEVVVESRRAA
jgi:hypothetical protein